MTTTQERLRDHFEDDPSPYTEALSPGNGSAVAPGTDTRVAVVTPDGTNNADLSNNERTGHRITVVHASGGSNSPAVSFDDGDFVGTGPSNLGNAGATATLVNVDGSSSGWVVVGTGSA